MASETITIVDPRDADNGIRQEPEPAAERGREGGPGEGSAVPDPAGASKAGENHDFPYFDFYPYGYRY